MPGPAGSFLCPRGPSAPFSSSGPRFGRQLPSGPRDPAIPALRETAASRKAARLAMRLEQYGVRRQRCATHPYVLYVRTELQAKLRSPCCVSSHPHAKRQMTGSVRRLPHVKQLPPVCVGLRPRAMRQLPSGVRAPRRVTQRLPLCVRPKRRAMHCFACRVKACVALRAKRCIV
jgi:hypothetical protein